MLGTEGVRCLSKCLAVYDVAQYGVRGDVHGDVHGVYGRLGPYEMHVKNMDGRCEVGDESSEM